MRIIYKRVVAYIIDIVLVTTIATLLSSNTYLNGDYENYLKTYNDYEKYITDYNIFINELDNLFKDEIIDLKKYDRLIENKKYSNIISKYYNDSKITKDEYINIKEKINLEHTKNIENYNYKIAKLSIMMSIMGILCTLMYFVAVQYCFYGQTLGKKIMKIRVESNNGKELNIGNFLIRSLILNEILINIISLILLMILSKSSYITYSEIIYIITCTIETTILFTLVFNKDNRGIHDVISNTKVVEVK